LFKDHIAQFTLNKIPEIWKRKHFAVVAIYRAFPAAGPGKRLIRAEPDGIGLQQFFRYDFFILHAAKITLFGLQRKGFLLNNMAPVIFFPISFY
jgi:hypothetical protein